MHQFKKKDAIVIGYLDSYFEYFECHDTPITMDNFHKFIDARGYNFSSVQVTLESTTVAVYPIDIHVPSRSKIACCEQYPLPYSNC